MHACIFLIVMNINYSNMCTWTCIKCRWLITFIDNLSGTYNNQYMVIDLKQIALGQSIKDDALWVVEQIPGTVVSGDQTPILRTGKNKQCDIIQVLSVVIRLFQTYRALFLVVFWFFFNTIKWISLNCSGYCNLVSNIHNIGRLFEFQLLHSSPIFYGAKSNQIRVNVHTCNYTCRGRWP